MRNWKMTYASTGVLTGVLMIPCVIIRPRTRVNLHPPSGIGKGIVNISVASSSWNSSVQLELHLNALSHFRK